LGRKVYWLGLVSLQQQTWIGLPSNGLLAALTILQNAKLRLTLILHHAIIKIRISREVELTGDVHFACHLIRYLLPYP
jgi:hypothetical protein